jgi:hypothetical protein
LCAGLPPAYTTAGLELVPQSPASVCSLLSTGAVLYVTVRCAPPEPEVSSNFFHPFDPSLEIVSSAARNPTVIVVVVNASTADVNALELNSVPTPDAAAQFWFDAVSSDAPHDDAFVVHVVDELNVWLDRCNSVVVFEHAHEYTRSSENVTAVTCLPRHAEVGNWNNDRYMFVPSPALPTFA